MIGILNRSQILEILHQQLVGRLACFDGDRIYIVPVSFAFDGNLLYAHSREGKKIELLRKNSNVSFQVDSIDSLASWRSILINGTYRELKTEKEQASAATLLENRFGPLHVSQSISRASADVHPPQSVEKKRRAVYFTISLDEVTGRFERP